MIDTLLQYGLFLAEAVTIVLSIFAVVFIVTGATRAMRQENDEAHLEVKKLNERYDDLIAPLRALALSKKELKAERKSNKKALKEAAKAPATDSRPRIYVLDFHGDLRASGVASLREEISAIIAMADKQDQVLLRLENSGGTVHEHGLAASQLARLKAHDIKLTVAVDKVAASGGYMMACIADHVMAAPFAILGSIGVLAQLPNFHRLLDSTGVDYEQFKGGEFKRTVTMFGENTDADREKFQTDIDRTHDLFKHFVAEHRPELVLEKVATGEHWFGSECVDLGLCDSIGTSDDWLMEHRKESDLFSLCYTRRPPLVRRLGQALQEAPAKVLDKISQRVWESRLGL